MKLRIEGLNTQQVDMLNYMWNVCETQEDLFEWMSTLPEEELLEAKSLVELVKIEVLDTGIEDVGCPDAIDYLERFRLNDLNKKH